jgi:hypothetical protein
LDEIFVYFSLDGWRRQRPTMARITGIGGVFFKSRKNSAALAAWYRKHLGMPIESFGGVVLKWPDDKAEDKGLTVWHIAENEGEWFSYQRLSFHDQLPGSITSAR